MHHFFKEIDYTNIVETKWQNNRKDFSMTVPIYNIPFCSQADATILCNIIENSPSKLIIDNHFETKNTSYSDTFYNRDVWIVLADGDNTCIFYHVAKVEFTKNTVLK